MDYDDPSAAVRRDGVSWTSEVVKDLPEPAVPAPSEQLWAVVLLHEPVQRRDTGVTGLPRNQWRVEGRYYDAVHVSNKVLVVPAEHILAPCRAVPAAVRGEFPGDWVQSYSFACDGPEGSFTLHPPVLYRKVMTTRQ